MKRKAVPIAELWEKYQKNRAKGIDQAYIKKGDYVRIRDREDLSDFGNLKETRYARYIVPVVKSYKAGVELWYYEVIIEGKMLILTDADIDIVYIKETEE